MADGGADAVSTDHDFRLPGRAVGERERDPRLALLDCRQAMIEMKTGGIDTARQNIQNIGAMNKIVRHTVTGGRRLAKFQLLTGLHIARQNSFRSVAHGGKLFAKSDSLERFNRLTADADTGADLGKSVRLFEDFNFKAEDLKRIRGRQAREAAADDCNPARLRHACAVSRPAPRVSAPSSECLCGST